MRAARPIEWDGEVVALLVHGKDGDYLVPPVVFDDRGRLVMGAEVLAAAAESDTPIEHPVLRDYTPDRLAELEQFLSGVRERLGVEGFLL